MKSIVQKISPEPLQKSWLALISGKEPDETEARDSRMIEETSAWLLCTMDLFQAGGGNNI